MATTPEQEMNPSNMPAVNPIDNNHIANHKISDMVAKILSVKRGHKLDQSQLSVSGEKVKPTDEETEKITIEALKIYHFLSEKSMNNKGRVLVEYSRNWQKITEEIMLQ